MDILAQIISSLIVGGLALVGVIITNMSSNRNVEHKIEVSQEVMKAEVSHLREEVEKLIPLASRFSVMEEQIKAINRRIETLEHKERNH